MRCAESIVLSIFILIELTRSRLTLWLWNKPDEVVGVERAKFRGGCDRIFLQLYLYMDEYEQLLP
ncbi:hypothetical protein [Coleofasciculus sp. FACHB-SPT36]|uniref:hypothetical protein n=1 Tax=Cyanophyceae TaxID=3028117 RepID=UPI00168AA901|nr:hypothetical protein [Coleofasciculus sp. FACHB-SPT36]MBD2539837.1 hypothetical protein [Coleofasciculus sp. FACHB-SPT36]